MKPLLLALVFSISLAGRISAQAPTCEDRTRELAIYADAVARARNRTEAEAAKTIAELVKANEALRAQLEALGKKDQ